MPRNVVPHFRDAGDHFSRMARDQVTDESFLIERPIETLSLSRGGRSPRRLFDAEIFARINADGTWVQRGRAKKSYAVGTKQINFSALLRLFSSFLRRSRPLLLAASVAVANKLPCCGDQIYVNNEFTGRPGNAPFIPRVFPSPFIAANVRLARNRSRGIKPRY